MTLQPATTLEGIREQIGLLCVETAETIALLRAEREQVEGRSNLFESPKAAYEYLDFFIDLFGRIATELDRVRTELAEGVGTSHAAVIRQIANDVWIDEQRCIEFRDKWINKPLPHEEVRSLLNQISIETRDQLLDYQTLDTLADRLSLLCAPDSAASKKAQTSFNRRMLFTRLFRR
jgi:hypothetical protein